MTIDRDDPNLTAFALGELDDAERAALEAELDPAALAEIEAIAELGALLEDELGREPCPELTPEQRTRIERRAARAEDSDEHTDEDDEQRGGRVIKVTWYRSWGTLSAAAGVLFLAGVFSVGTMSSKHASRLDTASMQEERSLFGEGDKVADEAFDYGALGREKAMAEADQAGPRPPRTEAPMAPMDPDQAPAPEPDPTDGDSYAETFDNPFVQTSEEAVSTFSIDVDTASYSNVRRFLQQQYRLPPRDAVRVEELVNYFRYDYAGPSGGDPFAVNAEVMGCPWRPASRLVRIGLQGRQVNRGQRPPCNLVFLLDVSGSMNARNKLPLLKQSLDLLLAELNDRDTVSIVVYAGASGVALPPTPASQTQRISQAFNSLRAGGSTNGEAAIQLAYQVARDAYVDGGVNRVILATDGDFNVGVTDRDELVELVRRQAETGVALTVLGLGSGNLNDHTMEQLADNGDGNYAYIDTLREAKRVLVDQVAGTLVTIAKDVKIQVAFDPTHVQSYRLIGYENRVLANRDFEDDTKDAGEVGAGHSVTALYEVVPRGDTTGQDLLTLRLRYKQPDGDTSQLMEFALRDSGRSFPQASDDARFAASVAAFGMLLRGSPHLGDAGYEEVLRWAEGGIGYDEDGFRSEFLELVRQAKQLSGGR
jgi:Ca-activated chloride channel homolog